MSLRLTRTTTCAMLLAAVLVGCSGSRAGDDPTSDARATTSASSVATPTAADDSDPATEYACQQFFGDPDKFASPPANEVLAMGASAKADGASDPEFFSGAGESVTEQFAQATPEVKQAAQSVSDWFSSEPEKGSEADLGSLENAYRGLAASCAEMSVGAAWESGNEGEAGSKPATLVCSHMAVQPQTFTVFENANVLPSNMFSLVGLAPRSVDPANMDQIKQVNSLLEEQKQLVDDPGVKSAIEGIQAPFVAAIDGDLNSPGLKDAMADFGSACDNAGFPGAVELSHFTDEAAEDEAGSDLP